MLIVSDKDYFLSHVLCMINVDRKKKQRITPSNPDNYFVSLYFCDL